MLTRGRVERGADSATPRVVPTSARPAGSVWRGWSPISPIYPRWRPASRITVFIGIWMACADVGFVRFQPNRRGRHDERALVEVGAARLSFGMHVPLVQDVAARVSLGAIPQGDRWTGEIESRKAEAREGEGQVTNIEAADRATGRFWRNCGPFGMVFLLPLLPIAYMVCWLFDRRGKAS